MLKNSTKYERYLVDKIHHFFYLDTADLLRDGYAGRIARERSGTRISFPSTSLHNGSTPKPATAVHSPDESSPHFYTLLLCDQLNIILPSALILSNRFLPFRIFDLSFVSISHPPHESCPIRPSRLGHPDISGEECTHHEAPHNAIFS
jgi:hypothetical protein